MICKSYIAGDWIYSKEPNLIKMYNPADTTQIISEVEYLNKEWINDAVNKAKSAFLIWRQIPLEERVELISEYLEKISLGKDKLANIISRENGKTLKESFAEISSGLNEAHYQLNLLGEFLKTNHIKLETRNEPLGVVLLITPWNFPFATIMRKLIPAVITGNSVIIKPSELTPMTSVMLFNLLEDIALPAGTINMVLGDGEVGGYLTRNKNISAISLTGSYLTGSIIKKQIANLGTKFQAEMGGKNTVAVMPDANIDKAAEDIVSNAYACCGQWCTGTSRVVVHSKIYQKLVDKIVALIEKIKIGNGFDELTDMGPLISRAQFNKVKSAVKECEGAKLLIGGKPPDTEELSNGYFFEPTLFTNVDPNSKLAQEEIFGPVLSIIIENSIEKMIKTINNSEYGLSFSVYTKDEELAEKFINEVESGLCHINLPTSHRDPSLPLLGWKNSGYGLPEAGAFAFQFFTKPKAVYRNYL